VVCAQICIPVDFNFADTGFSLDVGGVLEFYPSKRITVRFDAGDTIVNREGGVIVFPLNAPLFALSGSNFATHNLQLSAGVGFRF
jgi:hypothetical protein